MRTLGLILLGGIAGGMIEGEEGAAVGAFLGLVLSVWFGTRERRRAPAAPPPSPQLEQTVLRLESELVKLRLSHQTLSAKVEGLLAGPTETAGEDASASEQAHTSEQAHAGEVGDEAQAHAGEVGDEARARPSEVGDEAQAHAEPPEQAGEGEEAHDEGGADAAAQASPAPTTPPSAPPIRAPQGQAAEAFHVTSERLESGPPSAPQASAIEYATKPPQLSSETLREFFLGGNTVARVGILVLLVGVVLFLKYAAEQGLFPIELRMASAGLFGMGLVFIGLRQHAARPGFARTLQGGGIATMYLAVFFSYRTYALLPSGLAFALLATVAASSAVLAVVQDAMALVVIGQIGGFLAPILASSGSDNYIALFSYYLVLNLAIVGIAWFRAWRPLNVIGFVCTFGIGTTWGVMRYESERFATTEPFLIAFFLLYVAIPVLFALRDEARGWLDGSLVFGTPLAFLVLQRAMVDDMRFGMAYSTLALAALYVGLARYLGRRAPDTLRSMRDAFLALAVGFATMAVPYGLDNAGLTGATWALEGAGLYWIGVRQSRARSRFMGVLLQLLAGIALSIHLQDGPEPATAVLNTRTTGALLLCLGSLFIARHASRHRQALAHEWQLLQTLIGWGLFFLVARGLMEISEHVEDALQAGAVVALFGVLGLALELAGRRLDWRPGRYPPVLLFIGLLPAAFAWDLHYEEPLLAHGGAVGWPLYFAAMALTLRRLVPDAGGVVAWLHPLALWGATGWLALEAHRVCLQQASLGEAWAHAAALGAVALAVGFVTAQSPRRRWPFEPHRALYMDAGAATLGAALLLLGLLVGAKASGQTAPLPYLPILNPIDLAQLLGFAALIAWYRACGARGHAGAGPELMPIVPAVLAGFAFLWWNAMLARSVHQLADVPFGRRALWRSVELQVAFSISWTLIALGVTVLASRRGIRTLWMAGAVLLGVVVVKLFSIDLARLSTLAKIATFIVVGILLLAVGYLAPVPPSRPAPRGGDATDPEPEATP